MKFEDTDIIIKDIPHISSDQGRVLYNFILDRGIKNILELGFAHGKSTCYMASALHGKGSGLVTTIDIQSAKQRKPDIFTLLDETNLKHFVKPIFANRSYTWELMKMISKRTIGNKTEPIFDFCFALLMALILGIQMGLPFFSLKSY